MATSVATLSIVNAAPTRVVTANDIAKALGLSAGSVRNALSPNGNSTLSAGTIEKVKTCAQQMGYDPKLARKWKSRTAPTNSVFASRDAETSAMKQLYKSGHSSKETAHRCGVSVNTVLKRVGRQPAEITAANKKLAGQVRSAKANIKKAYQHQQTIKEYNALAARLNAHMLEVQKMQSSLNDMQKKADIASKATNVPLLRLLPNTKAC
jgi:DNA-binding CsgD family transcriptional regulator